MATLYIIASEYMYVYNMYVHVHVHIYVYALCTLCFTDSRSGGRLSAQPMVVISAGGDPNYPTLSMNLFPSLDEAGPRSEGRKGPIRTIIVQQQTSRNFT